MSILLSFRKGSIPISRNKWAAFTGLTSNGKSTPCNKSGQKMSGDQIDRKNTVLSSNLDLSEQNLIPVANPAISEFSANLASSTSPRRHEKKITTKVWYPNGVLFEGEYTLRQYRPSRYESLNTDSDISELADDDKEKLPIANDTGVNCKTVMPENNLETVESSLKGFEKRNAAIASASSAMSERTDLECCAETQPSHNMNSLTLSDGKLPSQNVGTLWKQLMKEREDRQECLFLMEQLQLDYDNLLQKYAKAENTIDVLRIYKGNEFDSCRLPSSLKERLNHQSLISPKRYDDFIIPRRHKHSSRKSKKHESHSKDSSCNFPSKSASQNTTNSIPEQEFNSNLVHPNNASQTNILKPSVISLQLRANCLEDEINFALLAMQDQSQSGNMCANNDAVEQIKSNLKLLVYDYEELKSFGRVISLEETISRLLKSLNELEGPHVVASTIPCQKLNYINTPEVDRVDYNSWKDGIPRARMSRVTQYSLNSSVASNSSRGSHRHVSERKERHRPREKNPSSGSTFQLANEECRSVSSTEVCPNCRRGNSEPRRISWPPSIEGQSVMTNWSMNSHFGRINASLCIDKLVRSSYQQEQMSSFGIINGDEGESTVGNNLIERCVDNSGLNYVSNPSIARSDLTPMTHRTTWQN